MRQRSSNLRAAVLAAVVGLLFGGPSALLMAQDGSGTSVVSSKPGIPVVTDELKEKGTEEELSKTLGAMLALMPENLRKPENMTVDELGQLVDSAILLHQVYETRFPNGAGRASWLPGIARLYVVNNTRYFVALSAAFKEQTGRSMTPEEAKAQRSAYWDRVIALISEALEGDQEPGPGNEALLATKGQAAWFAQLYGRAIETYELLLGRYPESDRRSEYLLAFLNAHLSARDYGTAVKLCDQFLAEFPRNDLAPHVYQLKAKGLLEAGRAQSVLDWWIECLPTLEAAAQGRAIEVGDGSFTFSGEPRKAFRRYADEGYFMLGFLRGYLGDLEGARVAFEDALVKLNELQEQGKLDPRSQVFRGRTDKVNIAYLTLVGEESPQFDLGEWIDGVPHDTASENGNVQILAFLPYENPRYYDFLQFLQQLYTQHWTDGLRVTWVADPKGFNDTSSQVGRVATQRTNLGLGYPTGLETQRGWPNFQKFQASVGGGTLIVVDRSGKVVWYKMDPTYRDENLVKGIVGKLLAEKP
jgi:tetratricopeptide (TPR) repeat protein